MSSNSQKEDVWIYVGVPEPESGNEEDGVIVQDIVTATEHLQDDRNDSPTEPLLKQEEVTPVGNDLLWLIIVCLMLVGSLWSMFLSATAPCHHVLTPTTTTATTALSTVVHQRSNSNSLTVISLTSLNFDDFVANNDAVLIKFCASWAPKCQDLQPSWEALALDAALGMQVTIATVDCHVNQQLCRAQDIMVFPTLRWFQNGRRVTPDYRVGNGNDDSSTTAELLLHYAHETLAAHSTTLEVSSEVHVKKQAEQEVELQETQDATASDRDGQPEATPDSDSDKKKAITKRASTNIQESTKFIVKREIDKKRNNNKAQAGEKPVTRGTLKRARSVGNAVAEHALIPTPAQAFDAGGAFPTSQSTHGSRETRLAFVHARVKTPTKKVPAGKTVSSHVSSQATTGDQAPTVKPFQSVAKKEEDAGQPPLAIKSPPHTRPVTKALAAVQIPVTVDTSRDIPVADKARMMQQESPVIEPNNVVVLTKENYRSFLSNNNFAFVAFEGPNCDNCDQLPTEWEAFAQLTKTDKLPVAVGMVDCANETSLCDKSLITTFPSFRWYQNAMPLYGYYRNYPRTSVKFLEYAKKKIAVAMTAKMS
jgi:thiol-disulfide isomerase/thioredoxin